MVMRPFPGWLLLLAAGTTVVVPAGSSAQVAAVRGVVVSRADGGPVASAEIHQLTSGVRVRTNADGRFSVVARAGDSVIVRVLG